MMGRRAITDASVLDAVMRELGEDEGDPDQSRPNDAEGVPVDEQEREPSEDA